MSPSRPALLALLGLLSSVACQDVPAPPPPRLGFGFAGSLLAPGLAPQTGSDRITFTSSFAISEGAADLAPDDPTLGRYRLETPNLLSNLPQDLLRLLGQSFLSGDGFLSVINDRPGSAGAYDALQLEIFPFSGLDLVLQITLVDEDATLFDSTLPPCTITLDGFERPAEGVAVPELQVPEVVFDAGLTGQLESVRVTPSRDNLRCGP